MTGDVSDAHEYALLSHLFTPSFTNSYFSIISVTSYTAVLKGDKGSQKTKKGKGDDTRSDEGGSWLGFFFKLLLLAGVVAGGYYGYQEYLRRQRYRGGGNFGTRPGGYTELFPSNKRY